ncbi:uncharacterized protein K441DRAFT_344095 [Cenococcum geophilum 1.58]|uniref:uncharacterized protein n=1 Tax=Cenococcum geophilum 1.58 TaxID=794803 RepID=UPI00358EDE73|nr:hypothetical protein K441DRAFT_344095 [Cenococcum geophilum 1.58]
MITGSLSKIPSCFYSDVFCILLAIIIVLSWTREDIVSTSRRILNIFYAGTVITHSGDRGVDVPRGRPLRRFYSKRRATDVSS